jgi:hypothetical protein
MATTAGATDFSRTYVKPVGERVKVDSLQRVPGNNNNTWVGNVSSDAIDFGRMSASDCSVPCSQCARGDEHKQRMTLCLCVCLCI